MKFGEKLKLLRRRSGLSQANLADKLWVSRAAVAKWENNIGMPDITNLKAIADFFQCELHVLVDDNLDMTDVKANLPAPDPNTYCGKSCEACDYKEKLRCPGCKDGPGNLHHGTCTVAKCCRNHCKSRCGSCTNFEKCSMVGNVFAIPAEREQEMLREQRRRERLKKQARYFSPRLWILFIGLILIEVGAFSNLSWFDRLPTVRLICNLLVMTLMVLYTFILFTMTPESSRFRSAGICHVIMTVSSGIILAVMGKLNLNSLIYILASWFAIYYEIHGYAEILESYHPDLSESWKYLWKICVLILFIRMGVIVVAMILRPLAPVLIIASSLIGTVISLLFYTHLFRTAKFFRNNIA